MDRRGFLSRVGALAAASSAVAAHAGEPEKPAAALPTIRLGKHVITRLIAGSNPINGYSYLGSHTDQHMREYFTVEQTVEFLLDCQRAGINAHQFSSGGLEKAVEIFDKARDRGLQTHLICLSSERPKLASIAEQVRPIAFVHHGGATDRLFHEGRAAQVRDYVKAARDLGVLAGVSAHNPDCIKQIADEGWDVDFFMTCFYFITRESLKKADAPPPAALELGYTFLRDDPDAMTRVVRQVSQPCLAFKILAAGRKCKDQATVRDAFRYAFENIKPTDGVIVGMYPRFFDEIKANVDHTRQFGVPAA
jgi:hypothetical protein